MRYLMDIFATESQFRPAYSFVAHGDGDADHQSQLWEVKHAIPILYHDAGDHHILTETIETWAHAHRAGSDGRFQILMEAVTNRIKGMPMPTI